MADETENKDLGNSADKKKGSKGSVFLLIPVILIVQAAIAYFIVGHFFAEKPEKPEEPPPPIDPKTVGQFLEIKDIVINPAGTLGRRYLVLEMSLETQNPEIIVEAETKTIWIRDSIISFLTKKTSEELLDITLREELKEGLLQEVNENLSTGKFDKLYFTKYIMQ